MNGRVFTISTRNASRRTVSSIRCVFSISTSYAEAGAVTPPGVPVSNISPLFMSIQLAMLLTGTPGGVTAPASAKLVEILKTHLMEDNVRRDTFRVEIVKTRPFMKAGDVVTATLHDSRLNKSLGGHENTVADANG